MAESIAEGILSTSPVSTKFIKIGTPRLKEKMRKKRLNKEKKMRGLSSFISTNIINFEVIT